MKHFSKKNGFTLIELIVVMTISSILLGLLAYSLNGVSMGYNRSQDKIQVDREATLALDTIIADLECLVIPGNRVTDSKPVEALRVSPHQENGTTTAWVTLLSKTNDEEKGISPGVVRAVSYKVAWQDPIDGSDGQGNPIGVLYRKVLTARETFAENMVASTDPRGEVWSNEVLSHPRDYLAGNVVDFQVSFLTKNSIQRFPANAIDDFVILSDKNSASDEALVAAEVSLTILTGKGQNELDAGTPLAEVIERFSRRYTRQTAIFPQTP